MYATWLYFLGTNNNPTEVFIYGLSLPTKQKIEYSFSKEYLGDILNGKHLFLFRSVKNIDVITINDNKINLTQFYTEKIRDEISFVYHKTFIQSHEECSLDTEIKSPITSLTHITSYYSQEIMTQNIDSDSYIKILKILEENSNQKFYGSYAKRLGCFEIAKIQSWAESNLPFSIIYNRADKNYLFQKEHNFQQDVYVVLKCYHSADEKIFEKHIFVPKNENNIVFAGSQVLTESHWGCRYSVYDTNGDILHQDCCIYLNEICFFMNIMDNNEIKIKDNFSKKDKKLEIITHTRVEENFVKDPFEDKNYSKIKRYYSQLLELVEDSKISSNEGCWFKKSQDTLSDIISYINSKLDKNTEVVIIDPYTDIDMMSLIVRICAAKIKIIASKKSFSKDLLKYHISKILNFKGRIKESKLYIDNSQIFYVPQDFHDRFIMIKKEKETLIYCFPNSINSMLKNDDFLILKLNGKVKIQAKKHIDDLLKLCTSECQIENMYDK